MKAVYLRFESPSAAVAALGEVLGWAATDGDLPTSGRLGATRYDIDEIGTIYEAVPARDEMEGPVQGAELPGWHVNVLWWGEDETAPDFGAAVIAPETPSRIFASVG